MLIPLDLTSFEKALLRLEEALKAYGGAPANTLYRDATIQRFEFTYEVAHKMLKRYLEMTAPNPAAIDEMAFADMIRTGSEQGLLRSGWDKWKELPQGAWHGQPYLRRSEGNGSRRRHSRLLVRSAKLV